ncbi:unnamed protein product, partial [Brassica napus]
WSLLSQWSLICLLSARSLTNKRFNTHWSHTHILRQTVGVPQCRAGDCGTFTLKYIEYNDENLATLGDVNRVRIG